MLARTDPTAPKHKGISYFLVPMDAPGISIVPLPNMAGLHGFNQVFFENVRVPARYRVGEENRGWYVAMTTLNFERSNISQNAFCRRNFDDLVAYCREAPPDGGGLAGRQAVRHRLAELAIEVEVSRILSYRVAHLQERGLVPNYEASVAKVFTSELVQRVARAGVEVMNLYGQLREGSKYARLRGFFGRHYLTSVSYTIAAGTSEVQRNIIATKGLGLPMS
jgi:alkylation response protein AidB-like acyl-CoA dehydrogenase